MRRMVLTILLPCLALTVVVVSLSQSPLPDADFVYAIGDEIKTLDPAAMSWNEDIRIALGLWEGLTAYDPCTSKAIAGVATLPPTISNDGQCYTFSLRCDARWSNGDPVTAEDFIYAWRRAIEPGTARDYAFFITDTIAGAAEYHQWRHNAVRTLTLLRDLAQGRGIGPDDAEFLCPILAELDAEKHRQPPASPETLLEHYSAAEYRAIAKAFRENHLAAMDDRFQRIGLRAIDPHTLQLRLVRPTAYLLDLLAFSVFLPMHHESLESMRITDDPTITDLTLWSYDSQWVKPHPSPERNYPGLITNGAFTLTDWHFKRYMLFEKNPHYWDRDNVHCRHILARIIPEPSTAFLAYEQGDIDWLSDVTRLDFAPALVSQARTHQRRDIHLSPAFGTYFYNFNCAPTLNDGTANPLSDPCVRMALNLAVNKQLIAEKVRKVGNPPAYHFIPPGSIPGYQAESSPSFDPERARALLREAGYPKGRGLIPLEIIYNTGYDHDKPAQAVAEMWRKHLGLDVSIQGQELKSFAEDRHTHNFTIARGSWFGDYMDPTTFLDMMTTGNGNNDSAFSNPDYDQLMEQAHRCTDPKARFQLLSQAETLINQQYLPVMPLYYYVNIHAFRDHVTGLTPNPRSMHPFKTIRVD